MKPTALAELIVSLLNAWDALPLSDVTRSQVMQTILILQAQLVEMLHRL